MSRDKGILIAIEGIDGAGKTTLVKRLADALRNAGETVVESKEPTDGKWGRQLRASAQTGRLSIDEETQLFIRDRDEHLAEKIMPALDRGEIVILDRYYYSTIAYQGARGNNVEGLTNAMRDRFETPDAVILLDASPTVTLDRISGSRGDTPNEFERQDALEATRAIFLRLAEAMKEILKVNAHMTADEVYNAVIHLLINGTLRAKRCYKSYECDVLWCSYRINHECRWAEMQSALLAR